MLNKARTVVAAGCVALLGCVVLLWVRSYRTLDCLNIVWRSGQHGPVRREVAAGPCSNYGAIGIGGVSRWAEDPRGMPQVPDGWEAWRDASPAVAPSAPAVQRPGVDVEALGFSLTWSPQAVPSPITGPNEDADWDKIRAGILPREHTTMHQVTFWVGAPDWAAFALLSLIPLLWLRRFTRERWRRQRRRVGLCESCGYDLRGTRGQCPECGTTMAREAPRAR
jgi:hypothetical protein